MLEAGQRLIIIKENEPHGEFINIVTTQLGLTHITPHSIMKAALKYSLKTNQLTTRWMQRVSANYAMKSAWLSTKSKPC
ncbi:hypothetical protein CE195_11935 [Sodalis-like symbiont of Philaenus spumarius]|nr:hypothetical protein CE195_11935 [Sodalis-like symbiont of Philaenus spumarius]